MPNSYIAVLNQKFLMRRRKYFYFSKGYAIKNLMYVQEIVLFSALHTANSVLSSRKPSRKKGEMAVGLSLLLVYYYRADIQFC